MEDSEQSTVMNILSEFFIVDLNYIIIEYIFTAEHEFNLIKTVKDSKIFNKHFCIHEDTLYMYNNNRLTSRIIGEDEKCMSMYSSNGICVYKNNIYITNINCIDVFNKACEITKAIKKNISHTYVMISADRIFTSEYKSSTIDILELCGLFVKNIKLEGAFSSMKTYNENIYVLTYSENIYKYSPDGNIIEKYEISNKRKNIAINRFFVIDDVIYLNMWSINEFYEYRMNKLTKKEICNKLHINYCDRMVLNDDNLLVLCGDSIHIFKIVKKKFIYKKLIV